MNGDERPDLRVLPPASRDYLKMWEEDSARLKGQIFALSAEIVEKDKALKEAADALEKRSMDSPDARAQALGLALTYFSLHGKAPENTHALILVAEPLRAFLAGEPEPARAEVVTSVDDE